MNEKNLEFLEKQILYTGFGEKHGPDLAAKIERGESDIALFHNQVYGKDEVAATLHLKKSGNTDMYFFNKYSVALKKEGSEDVMKQTFYLHNKEDSITLKEAYNLMNGRAIHKERLSKENEPYKAWLTLNFKETEKDGSFKMHAYHSNYGYDLTEALGKHSIKEMSDPEQKDRLIASLERGNKQQVTMEIKGQEQKVGIEASPRFKSINVYSASGQRMKSEELFGQNGQEHSKTEKQEVKTAQSNKETAGEEEEGGEKKQRRRQRQSL